MKRYTQTRGIRFDEETLEVLEKNIRDYETETGKRITISAYIRNLIERDELKNMLEDIDYHMLKDMRRKVIGIATNINQLSHRNNSEIFSLQDLELLQRELNEVHEIYQMITHLMEHY